MKRSPVSLSVCVCLSAFVCSLRRADSRAAATRRFAATCIGAPYRRSGHQPDRRRDNPQQPCRCCAVRTSMTALPDRSQLTRSPIALRSLAAPHTRRTTRPLLLRDARASRRHHFDHSHSSHFARFKRACHRLSADARLSNGSTFFPLVKLAPLVNSLHFRAAALVVTNLSFIQS